MGDAARDRLSDAGSNPARSMENRRIQSGGCGSDAETERGISAVGSAPHWQCGGHGFKSRMLQRKESVFTGSFHFCVALTIVD